MKTSYGVNEGGGKKAGDRDRTGDISVGNAAFYR